MTRSTFVQGTTRQFGFVDPGTVQRFVDADLLVQCDIGIMKRNGLVGKVSCSLQLDNVHVAIESCTRYILLYPISLTL